MNTRALHPGDLVDCQKLGRPFQAHVTGKPAGGLVPVQPVDRNVTYMHLRGREIKGVIAPATSTGQLTIVEPGEGRR